MKPRHKDNLTDAIEGLQRNDNASGEAKSDSEDKKKPQQVLDNEGNPVTLGQTGRGHTPFPNKRNHIELSPEELGAITKAVAAGVADALDKFLKKLEDKKSVATHS